MSRARDLFVSVTWIRGVCDLVVSVTWISKERDLVVSGYLNKCVSQFVNIVSGYVELCYSSLWVRFSFVCETSGTQTHNLNNLNSLV